MPVAQHPLHRSVGAGLPYAAPALGVDDQTLARTGVAYFWSRKPVIYQAVHAGPGDVALAAAAQCASPYPYCFTSELHEACAAGGYAKVAAMPAHHGFQVVALLGDGSVHALSRFHLERLNFSSYPLGTGLSRDFEPALLGLAASTREAQEVKGLRLARSSAVDVASGVAPELDPPRLVWMQPQAKGFELLGYAWLERLCVANVLKACKPVVGVSNDDDLPHGMALPPLPYPRVKCIVQVDVGKKGADAATLNRPDLALRQPVVLQHASPQPRLYHADDARVADSVLGEFDQPLVFDGVEKFADVCIAYEVHPLAPDSNRYSVQCVVCAAPGSKAVARPEKVLLVYGVKYFNGGALDDFVSQRWYGQRPFCTVGFVDIDTLYGLMSIPFLSQSVGQVGQICLQVLSILRPRHAVNTSGCTALYSETGILQAFDGVHVVQQYGELRLRSAFGRLSCAVKRDSHVIDPARSPGHARCNSISLGLWPSLHEFGRRRSCTRSFVRPLQRYYTTVRLPASIAHRCTPIGFLMRSAALAWQQGAEDSGISRFPGSVFVCLYRVSDRVGSKATSPKRLPQRGLRLPTVSAPKTTRALLHRACISRLNGWPAEPPVNASPMSLRTCTHDSEPA